MIYADLRRLFWEVAVPSFQFKLVLVEFLGLVEFHDSSVLVSDPTVQTSHLILVDINDVVDSGRLQGPCQLALVGDQVHHLVQTSGGGGGDSESVSPQGLSTLGVLF